MMGREGGPGGRFLGFLLRKEWTIIRESKETMIA